MDGFSLVSYLLRVAVRLRAVGRQVPPLQVSRLQPTRPLPPASAGGAVVPGCFQEPASAGLLAAGFNRPAERPGRMALGAVGV